MLPMLSKHTIITAALLATLSLAACGKKKEVIEAPPQPPQTQTPEEQKPKIPNSNPETPDTGDTDGQIGGGLPDPNSGSDDDYTGNDHNDNDGDDSNDNDNDNGNRNGGGGHSNRPSTRPNVPPPPVVDNEPTPDDEDTPETPDEVLGEYVSNDARNVDRDDFGKRLTGGVAPDGLLYTSSSTDGLLDFLRARNNKVSPETRRKNIEAAASVLLAKMSIDRSGEGAVTLRIQEKKGIAVYNLAGSAQAGPENRLRVVESANGEDTTGTRDLEGTWKCVDLDGGCLNVFVRLKIGTTPNSDIINVVFRNTKTDLWFSLPKRYSDSPEFLRFRELAINTIQKNRDSENRLRSATMNSWEVVNGRSGMTLSMKTYNDERFAFVGPLLAPESGTGVDIPLSLSTTPFADARVVANNGLGQVRVAIKMKKYKNFAQDKFAITFMRRIKPIVELTDENLR